MLSITFLACKQLGWQEIPCIVIESTPEDDDWYMLSENLQRDDLSEIEKAEKLHEMMFGDRTITIRKAADKLGLSIGYISNLLQLHGYPGEAVDELRTTCAISIREYSLSERFKRCCKYAIPINVNRKKLQLK